MRAFLLVSTQWRVGFGGIYALDYGAVKHTLRALHIPFKSVFTGLRVMEQRIVELTHREQNNAK